MGEANHPLLLVTAMDDLLSFMVRFPGLRRVGVTEAQRVTLLALGAIDRG